LEILLSQHGQQARQILWRALGIEANAQRQSDTTSVPKKGQKSSRYDETEQRRYRKLFINAYLNNAIELKITFVYNFILFRYTA